MGAKILVAATSRRDRGVIGRSHAQLARVQLRAPRRVRARWPVRAMIQEWPEHHKASDPDSLLRSVISHLDVVRRTFVRANPSFFEWSMEDAADSEWGSLYEAEKALLDIIKSFEPPHEFVWRSDSQDCSVCGKDHGIPAARADFDEIALTLMRWHAHDPDCGDFGCTACGRGRIALAGLRQARFLGIDGESGK